MKDLQPNFIANSKYVTLMGPLYTKLSVDTPAMKGHGLALPFAIRCKQILKTFSDIKEFGSRLRRRDAGKD